MPSEKNEHQWKDIDLDSIFEISSKYNESIKLTEDDKNSNIKVYCKEPYAQELYDAMNAFHAKKGTNLYVNKDLNVGQICEVKAVSISFDTKTIIVSDITSRVEISIPFKEYTGSIDELAKGDNLLFSIMVIKNSNNEGYIGSERKCADINYKKEILSHFNNKTWFEVKIQRLIKGGYVALYKNSVECFIPGSHAGANVIKDFSKLLGKTLNVMVDNYDQSNDLFIVSYKKYITNSMQYRVSDLKFGNKYTGILTNKPYDFGMFVEFEGYFTGLIHSSEFSNYNEIKNSYKSGDTIDFYIKNVTKKNNQYRVVLTLNEEEIDSEKKQWDDLRNRTENKTFDYDVDSNNNSIKIHIDGESYDVTLKRKDLDMNLNLYPKVRVYKVDPINKNLKFEFVGSD